MNFWDWFNSEAKPRLNDRAKTFEIMFQYLDKFERPVSIIETGCLRTEGNWAGDGQSTLLFDKYVQEHGGTVHSVDINPEATKLCRPLVSKAVKVHTGDSISFLRKMSKKGETVDLLYLDAFDLDPSRPLASQIHHYKELEAALPMVSAETLVVVDDSPARLAGDGMIEPTGKGGLVARYADEVGATNVFLNWQAGWIKMNGPVVPATTHEKLDDELKSLTNRAYEHFKKGHDLNAGNLYRLVLELVMSPVSMTPVMRVSFAEACVFFARLSLSQDRIGTAYDWYMRALSVDPRNVGCRLEMASKVLRKLKFWEAGRAMSYICTLMEPDNINAWGILGSFEQDLNNVQNTIACYDKALEIDPDSSSALTDRCALATELADHDTVRKLSERLLKTDRRAEAKHFMALLAYRESRHEDSIRLYDEAIAEGAANLPSVHWNKSHPLGSIGRFKELWAEQSYRVEDKLQAPLSVPFKRFARPLWTGEPAPASIHVHMEAGAGDNICCSRYFKLMHDRGYDVRYECYPDMLDMMRRNFPYVTVVPQAADYPGVSGISQFDYHLPIGEVQKVFGTEVDSVPWYGPYLKADPKLSEKYRKILDEGSPSLKVGLCWSSGIRKGIWIKEYGQRKSMHFNTLAPLFELSNKVKFVSLQVGPEREQLESPVLDILPEQPTWDDTMAVMDGLDIVIAVDTAAAHLAGAMGKKTWVLAQRDAASWHFMCWRPGALWNERSPWYPTARIFRQHEFNRPHFWDEVIEDVRMALKNGIQDGTI